MNKFQKLAQIKRDIELLENAGKIKAAEILHQKFIKEAQYAMPQMMTTMMPQMMMPQMMPMMMPQMMARPMIAPTTLAKPVVAPAQMPVAQPRTTPVQTIGTPNPGVSPAPTPAPKPVPSPGNMKIAPEPSPAPPPPPSGQTTPPKPTPTEGGNYGMIPGPGGKTIFTDPGTGNAVDPPGSQDLFDTFYGQLQDANRYPEPHRSQYLQFLRGKINDNKKKLGDRLFGSLFDVYLR